uniref:ORF1ab polyprotein n=1 Tax=Bird deltacoronavirus HKU19 TaxID=3237952 RepID=A0AB39AFV7_9NIDO
MGLKQVDQTCLTIPPNPSKTLSLFLTTVAAEEGKIFKTVDDVKTVSKFNIRRGNIVPGVLALDNHATLSDFENLVGIQPVLRTLRELLKSSDWAETTESLWKKAMGLTWSKQLCRAVMLYGSVKLSSLAALVFYNKVLGIRQGPLSALMRDIVLTEAVNGTLAQKLLHFTKVEVKQTDDYLTLTQKGDLSDMFKAKLLLLSENRNGFYQYKDYVFWPAATALKTENTMQLLYQQPLPVVEGKAIGIKDIKLAPTKATIKTPVTGDVVRIGDINYIIQEDNPPLYLPLVDGGVAPQPLREVGTVFKTVKVTFHAPPNDILHNLITIQASARGAIVDFEKGTDVGENVKVYVGPSQPGDIVVHDDEDYIKCFQKDQVRTIYNIIKDGTMLQLYTLKGSVVDNVFPIFHKILSWLNKVSDLCGGVLSALVAGVTEQLLNIKVSLVMQLTNFQFVASSTMKLVTNITQLNTILSPLLTAIKENSKKLFNMLTFSVTKDQLIFFDDDNVFVANVVTDPPVQGTVYDFVTDTTVNCTGDIYTSTCEYIKPIGEKQPTTDVSTIYIKNGKTVVKMAYDGDNCYPQGSDDTIIPHAFKVGGLKPILTKQTGNRPKKSVTLNETTVEHGEVTTYGSLNADKFTNPQGPVRKLPGLRLILDCQLYDEDTNTAINEEIHGCDDTWEPLYYDKGSTIEDIEQLVDDTLYTVLTDQRPDLGVEPVEFILFNAVTNNTVTDSDVCNGNLTLQILPLEDDECSDSEDYSSGSDVEYEEDDPTYFDNGDDSGAYPIVPLTPISTQNTTSPTLSDQKLCDAGDAQSESEVLVDTVDCVEEEPPVPLKSYVSMDNLQNSTDDEEAIPVVPGMENVIVDDETQYPQGDCEDIVCETDEEYFSDSEQTLVGIHQHLYNLPVEAIVDEQPTQVEFHVGDIRSLKGLRNAIIVNAANERLTNGGGVAKAISDLAGPEYQATCDRAAPISKPLLTNAYDLVFYGYAGILHVVPPRGNDPNVKQKLYEAYKSVFTKPSHYVIPVLGAGIFGCNPVDSLQALKKALPQNIGKVTIMSLDKEHKNIWDAINATIVTYTYDMDQLYTGALTKDQIKQLNLFDGVDYVSEAIAGNTYLAVSDKVVANAKELGLTMPQYYKYLDYCSLQWKVKKTNFTHLVVIRNNCFITAALDFLQHTHVTLRQPLDGLYKQFVNGNVEQLVAWCYAVTNQTPGETGDAVAVLSALLKYNTDTIIATTECCGSKVDLDGMIFTTTLKDFKPTVHCVKCDTFTGLSNLQVPGIVVACSTAIKPDECKTTLPTIRHNASGVGHWFAALNKGLDGSPLKGATVDVIYFKDQKPKPLETNLLDNVVLTNRFQALPVEQEVQEVSVEPVKQQEPKSDIVTTDVKVLDNPDSLDILALWIEKPAYVMVKSFKILGTVLFATGKVLQYTAKLISATYKFLRKTGLLSKTTGTITDYCLKIVKDNVKTFTSNVNLKFLFGICRNYFYNIMTAILPFLLLIPVGSIFKSLVLLYNYVLSYTSVCDVDILPKYEETKPYSLESFCFDKPHYCMPCLKGKDSIHFYKHLVVQYTTELGYDINVTLCSLIFVLLCFKPLLFVLTTAMIMLINSMELYIPIYGTYTITYTNTYITVIIVNLLYRAVKFIRHLIAGCNKVGCSICAKKSVYTVLNVETVIQGRKFVSQVTTNGGAKFCEKHNFYCLNCDNPMDDGTFIPVEAVESLSKATNTHVRPTSVAYAMSRDITCNGDVFMANVTVNGKNIVTCNKYTDVRTVDQLKKPDLLSNYPQDVVIACDFENVAAVNLAKQMAVVMSMVLRRFVLIIDQQHTKPVNSYEQVKNLLNEFFSFQDLTQTGDLIADVKNATNNQVSDTAICAAKFAVDNGLDLTMDNPNNTVPHYAFDFNSLPSEDKSTLMDFGIGSSVLKGTSYNIVLPYNLLAKLSVKTIIKLKSAAMKNGVKLLVTPSTRVIRGTLSVIPFTTKTGGNNVYATFLSLLKLFLTVSVVAFLASCIVTWLFTLTPPTTMSHIEASNFRVIRNGVIDSIRASDNCFSNKYVSFDSFLARPYTNDPSCPVVIANVYVAGDSIPGIPGHLFHRDNIIMHAYDLHKYTLQQLFETPASTWNAPEVAGYTQYSAVQGSYKDSYALFTSKCTYLTYKGGRELYCYDNMTVQETLSFMGEVETVVNKTVKLYSELKPHVRYMTDTVDGKIHDVIIPEQLWYIPYLVKFTTNLYCRIGECFKTNPGYCLSFTNKFVVNDGIQQPGVYCGDTLFQLLTNMFFGMVSATDVMKSSTALLLSTSLIIGIVFLVMLFQRIFKQYTSFVGVVVLNAFLNIIGLIMLTICKPLAYGYFGLYFYVTLTLTPITRSIIYVFMVVTLIPHVSNFALLACFIVMLLYNIYKYVKVVRYTASGGFKTFLEASKATFVISNDKYVEMLNLAGSDYDTYLASYARYRYYSGTTDSAEYNKVCMAFLAKALDNFKTSGGSVLYTPPKLTVVQAGIKRLLSPSGSVEKCMVSVHYRGLTLNGIWLNNVIYCPRHILGKYQASFWQDAVKVADTRDFVINSQHSKILFRPVGLRLNNAILQIVLPTEQNNPHTPDYEFVTAKPGSSMTIACTYDGIVSAIYHVIMQTNGLIYASFMNGACGSVGYTIKNGKLLLHYMHHLEFNNKTHGGTDLNGNFYGDYIDEEIAQSISKASTLTDNAIAHIYAHLSTISTKPKWLSHQELSVEDFNEWAKNNDHTQFPSCDENYTYLDALAKSTGVSIKRVLSTLVALHTNWGSASVLGMSTFDLDFTPEMVYNQVPITLQSTKKSAVFTWFASIVFNFIVYMTALMYVIPNNLLHIVVPATLMASVVTQLFIKHTTIYMLAYCLPMVVLCVYNTFTIWVPNTMFRQMVYYAYTCFYEPAIAQYLVYLSVFLIIISTVKSLIVVRSNMQALYALYNLVRSIMFGYTATMLLDNGHVTTTYIVCFVASMSPTGSLLATFNWYLADYLASWCCLDLLGKMFIYHSLGFVVCMRFGLYWWVAKFTGLPVGSYKFVVSSEQLKYMMATRMSPPKNFVEVLLTNMKLLGVGGKRDIAISTVQNKTLDIKATAVIIAQLLEKVGVTNKTEMCKKVTQLHNNVLASKTAEEAEPHLYALLVYLLPHFSSDNLDKYFDSLLQHKPVLQVVAEAFIHLDSYKIYKDAQQAYDEAVERGAEASEIKKALKAVNIAKAEYDRDVAAEKKLAKLADSALKSMYLAERSEDRKAKLTSGLTAMLYHMLRRVDSDKVKALFELAKSDVVPLHAITGSSTDGLKVIIGDQQTYDQYVTGNQVIFKGRTYVINTMYDLDNQILQEKPQSFPIVLECTKLNVLEKLHNMGWDNISIKLQNNELYVRNVFCAQSTCTDSQDNQCTGKTFYVSQSGNKILVAVTSTNDNLRTVTIAKDDGSKVVLNLEQPMRFAHMVNGKQLNTYLYFVANIKTIYRGMIIGHISSTVSLQASGTSVEYQENNSLLTYLAFAVNPREAYLAHISNGGKPIQGAVRVIAPQGEGFAVTTKPQPNAMQHAYGGASICLYCRAHVTHPSMDGRCSYKGRFVHIDKDLEPTQFALTHEPCTACHRWVNHDCTCTNLQLGYSSSQTNSYLNRVKGSSDARLEPCTSDNRPDVVVRAFNIYNNATAGIFKSTKNNCTRFRSSRPGTIINKPVRIIETFFVTKQCTESVFRAEEQCYNMLPKSIVSTDEKYSCVAYHDFFKFDGVNNVVRRHLTKYTLLDLVYALRHLSTSQEVIQEILITMCGTSEEWFTDGWYDPIENPTFYDEFHKLGSLINNCVVMANKFADTCKTVGLVGILTADNQDLGGQIYDFGDFIVTQPGNGCIEMDAYLSYIMPSMSMTHMLKCECLDENGSYKDYSIYQYDFTDYKMELFNKYFRYWSQTYHPNCVDCVDDRCIVHCANFNILFAMCLPNTCFGNLCSQATVDGHPIVQTVGLHSKELGIVMNQDVNNHMSNINMPTLLRLVGDPTTMCSVADACLDLRTPCQTIASIASGATKQSVKPGHFNAHFYEHALESGILSEESGIDIRHFYYMQDGEAAIKDYSYYRYNTPTMVDIKQFLFVMEVADKYLSFYDGGCIPAETVVVNNLDKSAGYPFNKLGKARNYYDLTYAEQNAMFEYTKRNVLPTVTQMNLKYAISAKDRARTVAGVSIISTMTNRQYHQKLLKSISVARNQTIVIGTTKFYGGWDNMLRNLMANINNPKLAGWDYPKCDRSMPNILRITSSLLLARKHTCCTHSQRFYRLANECAQVLSEIVVSGNVMYVKPGGTSSGDATTAYANSVFNILQVVSANIARFMSTSAATHHDADVMHLHRQIYDDIYRGSSNDSVAIQSFYEHLQKYFGLMILSDDGVACIDQDAAKQGMVADLDDFRDVLFYQNNVYMSDSKCWIETDMSKGPHEFCSQHTVLAEHDGEPCYYPYPDVSRILGACLFVNETEKTDPVQNLERYISLAIDAYPLTKVDNKKGKVFYVLLDYIRKLANELQEGIMDAFQTSTDTSYINNFVTENFYSDMYAKAPVLQATGSCVVCGSPTILRCGECIRRPLLCCVCCYNHVTRTDHKRVIAINNYICSVENCNEDNVEELFISGTAIYCRAHKPVLCIPIVANGTVFGIYRHTARGSDDIDLFNQLATSDYTTIEPYQLANKAPVSLMLFAAETIKAKEEAIKRSYATATVKEVYDSKLIKLSWEHNKKVPPITKNHIFTGYHFNKNGKTQVGDYILVKCDGDSYSYKATSTYKLQVGDVLVLMSHVVTPLSAPPMLAQTNYTKPQQYASPSEAAFYSTHFKSYDSIAKQKITTVLGPPGTGKSTFAIGLAKYFPNARICYTASSHAAIDALCEKAFKTLPREQCSRIVPTRTTVECFSDFVVNNTTAKYVFSTINALPDIKCDIVVVDEISMLTNYELSSVNARLSYNHIVYVGDPYQLPSPRTMLTSGQLQPVDYNVVTSIMVQAGADVMLNICFRCPAEIVYTVSKLVYDNKLLSAKPASKQCYKVIVNNGNNDICYEGCSAFNQVQLDFALAFVQHKRWTNSTFISPYNAMNVKASMAGFNTQTVDSSQGSEYDYVVFCVTTDSGHALNMARLNVALTRAKIGILVVFRNNDELYKQLEFEELDVQAVVYSTVGKSTQPQVQSLEDENRSSTRSGHSGTGLTSLFKRCAINYNGLPPQYALTWNDVGQDYKLQEPLAKIVGVEDQTTISYKYLVSCLGMVMSTNIETYHSMFLTKQDSKKYVNSWIGFDVEAAHAIKPHTGTNLPLQLGFSTGHNFSVIPEGLWVTESGTCNDLVAAKIPPGAQFSHLKKDMKNGKPWTSIRPKLVQLIAETTMDSDFVTFVTWAHQLELATMRYFVKIGQEQKCDCGRRANFTTKEGTSYGCKIHYHGFDYVYNPFLVDVANWGYTGSLSSNHDTICHYHKNAHVASSDAEMTICVAIHQLFDKVDWELTFPITPENDALNKACRLVQSNYLDILLTTTKAKIVHDVGNPKGIKAVHKQGVNYKFYDMHPISAKVQKLCYTSDYEAHIQDGLSMFWNCNVDVYPSNALVCRYDTHKQKHLIGPNGSALYINKHAFLTPPMPVYATHKLRLAPIVYYSHTDCSTEQPIVMTARDCITRCNNGSTICAKHVAEYNMFVQSINLMAKHGFNVYVPKDINLYNCWLSFTNLQTLENLAYNCYYKNTNQHVNGSLDVIINNNTVSTVVDGRTVKLFENYTNLPVSVAFEHYTNRHTDTLPSIALLASLGVTCTRNFTVWRENDTVFTNTINVSSYTDVLPDKYTVLMDERYGTSYSEFCQYDNAVFLSPFLYKKAKPIVITSLTKNGVRVYDCTLYVYWRCNGEFQQVTTTLYSQQRSVENFKPLTKMEMDFLSMSQDQFIQTYDLTNLGVEHILYGDTSKSILGGCHALISLVHSEYNSDFITHLFNPVQNMIVTADNGSSKNVCSVIDLIIDDYIGIIRQAHSAYETKSKVFTVVIDNIPIKFTIWHDSQKVDTLYPLVQALTNGYQMPSVYKHVQVDRQPCDIKNYHEYVPKYPGVTKNVLKYRQLCQYINKIDKLAVPHNMTILHLGAASIQETAPGTTVLRQMFPEGTVIIDLDIRDFVSDANQVIVTDYRTYMPPQHVDVIFSDLYSNEGESFFKNLVHIVKKRLAIGGSMFIKFTETSYSAELYELAGYFSDYNLFTTAVNATSSEVWLCCFNYLNECKTVINGEQLHSSYILWRNETILTPTYSTLADNTGLCFKLKATPCVTEKEYEKKPILKLLVAEGKLLVKPPSKCNLLF